MGRKAWLQRQAAHTVLARRLGERGLNLWQLFHSGDGCNPLSGRALVKAGPVGRLEAGETALRGDEGFGTVGT